MFDIGFSELLVIATVALIVMGPERLPQTVRSISLWIGRLKQMIASARKDFEQEVGMDDIRQQLHNEKIMRDLSQTKEELQQTLDATALEAASIEESIKSPVDTMTALDSQANTDSKKPRAMSEEPLDSQPFMAHLIEFRDRLLRAIASVALIFIGLFSFSNELYLYVSEPLRQYLPDSSTMIATDVTSPFLTPFKLTLVLSLFAAMPYVLYQVWAFVAPGLYKREKKIVIPLFCSSVILFYAGMAFAYYVVFPLVFMFFTSVGPEGVSIMTDIRSYLDFVLKLFFAFGISFEIPIAVVILSWMGAVDPDNLAKKRPYVFILCFVFGMLLTPPDILSQTLLAIPMWLLFEIGIMFGRLVKPKPDNS